MDVYCDKCDQVIEVSEEDLMDEIEYLSYDMIASIIASKINKSKWEEGQLIQALQDYVNPNIGIYDPNNE